MKLGTDDAKKYPRFAHYVKHDMADVAKVDRIIDAIKKYAGATKRETIKKALRWNLGPTIEVVHQLTNEGRRAYGSYKWGSNVIRLDESLVKAFEEGRDLRKTKAGKLVHVAGATLLHELTHWADAKDGFDNPVPGDPGNEEGNAFDMEAYRRVIVL
jgi:hypothetical protein